MTDETPTPDSNFSADIIAKANLFWLILLVILTAAGVYLLIVNLRQAAIGVALLSMALLLFWSMEDDGGAPQLWIRIFERLASASDIILIVIAAGCSIGAARLGLYLEQEYNPVLADITLPLCITGGAIIFLMHCPISWQSLREWWRDYRLEIIVVLLMTLAAGALRFYKLDSIPNIIEGDEGWTGLAALKKLPIHPFYYNNPFAFLQGFGQPYLDLFAAAIDFFGQNKLGLRFIPALGGTLAIPATYIFARRLLGVRNATIAALLLMVSHAHIHFSRTAAMGYQQSTWLIPLELYCLLKGLEERNRNWMVMSGLLLGLHFNVYFSAQVIIPMIFVFLGMVAFIPPPQVTVTVGEKVITRHPLPLRENLHHLPWFLGSILVLAFPALVWAFNHPAEFSARWAMEGSIQSGWLMQEVVLTGKPIFLILWERFAHVCLSIFILPFKDFYWAPAPVLDMITGALFVIGAFLALRRTRDPKILLLNGWFWSGVVAIGLFAIPVAADSYRLMMVLPALCILAALGWAHLTSLAERMAKTKWRMIVAWSVILVVLIAALNLKIYFIDFGRSCLYGGEDPSKRMASLMGDYLREQMPFEQVYLLRDEKFSYGAHLSIDYLSGPIPTIINLGQPFVGPDAHGSVIFLIVPSRLQEQVAVRNFAPGGQMIRIGDCGKLMFLAYRAYIP